MTLLETFMREHPGVIYVTPDWPEARPVIPVRWKGDFFCPDIVLGRGIDQTVGCGGNCVSCWMQEDDGT